MEDGVLLGDDLEDLAAFKVSGKSIEIKDIRRDTEDFAVFGVRACDAKAMNILDRVFLTEPRDSYYANRREHGVIITLACGRPDENCFCTAFGIDPTTPGGDISAWKTEDAVYFEAITEKGEYILEIKTDGAMPLWLSHALDELKIYPTSFSKYGKAYEDIIKNDIIKNKERGIING